SFLRRLARAVCAGRGTCAAAVGCEPVTSERFWRPPTHFGGPRLTPMRRWTSRKRASFRNSPSIRRIWISALFVVSNAGTPSPGEFLKLDRRLRNIELTPFRAQENPVPAYETTLT